MKESKITVSYRQARSKERQIVILSQLNACASGDIVDILLRQGFAPEDLPKRYRPGKIICKQCGVLFDGNSTEMFCQDCDEKRRKEQIQKKNQRARERRKAEREKEREKREAEYADNPKRCAECGAVVESRRATYCKSCAAARSKESIRRSKQKRHIKGGTI